MVTDAGPGRSVFPHLGPPNWPAPITNAVRLHSPTSWLRGPPGAVAGCPASSPWTPNKTTQLIRTSTLLLDTGPPRLPPILWRHTTGGCIAGSSRPGFSGLDRATRGGPGEPASVLRGELAADLSAQVLAGVDVGDVPPAARERPERPRTETGAGIGMTRAKDGVYSGKSCSSIFTCLCRGGGP